MTFWKQLKQRRMFQVVAAYAAAGWVAIEVVDQLTDQGVVPAFFYPLALIWYLYGLPAALILGWYHGEKGAQKVSRFELFLLALVMVGALGTSSVPISNAVDARARAEAALSALNLKRIAVLYLDDLSPDGAARHIADGFTEGLIDEFSTVREFDVISRNGVAPYRATDVPADSIGRALDAGTVVDGAVEPVGDQLRVTLRLLDGQSGQEYQRTSFTRPLAELDRARDDLVESTSALLREWLGEEFRTRRSRTSTDVNAAWALYQRGEQARKEAEARGAAGDGHAMDAAFERADSLLAQAEVLDPDWVNPPVLRGAIAYRRARIAGGAGDVHTSAEWIEAGLPHVERALALEPNHARALEIRGTLKYLYRLLEVDHDRHRLARILTEAQEDLERAVELDPSLASAHATLGHLHLRRDYTAAMISSRRAYEEDAYLENADLVVDRIFYAAYNLEQFNEARRWCDTGAARFPENHRFALCRLILMTRPGSDATPEEAWATLARLDSLAPAHQAEADHLEGLFHVGGVLAKAGMPDSARAVWSRARAAATPHVDPQRFLLQVEAYVRTVAGDDDVAIDLLKRNAAANPGASFEDRWWFRSLLSHPRWSELAATEYH